MSKISEVISQYGKTVKIRCRGVETRDYRVLRDLQGSLKTTDHNKIFRLAESLLRFGLVNPLQIWVDPAGPVYCFDAHHRKKALELLEQNGVTIPLVPVSFCLAEDLITAKTLLLAKESKYSWIDIKGVEEYLNEINLTLDLGSEYFELPALEFEEEKGKEFFDDEVDLSEEGKIKEKDAFVKVSIFCHTDVKKEIVQDLKTLEQKYGPNRLRLV